MFVTRDQYVPSNLDKNNMLSKYLKHNERLDGQQRTGLCCRSEKWSDPVPQQMRSGAHGLHLKKNFCLFAEMLAAACYEKALFMTVCSRFPGCFIIYILP